MSDWGFDSTEAETTVSDLDKGGFVDQPGWYHVSISDVDLEYVFPGDSQVALDGIHLDLEVLAPAQFKGSSTNINLSKPDFSQSEKGREWAKKKLVALFLASGIYTPGGPMPTDEQVKSIKGRQICVKLEWKNDEQKYLQLAWASIHHVDDPKANGCPKNEAAISILPPALRGDPKTKAANGSTATPAANGNGNGSQVQQPAQQQQPAATGGGKNWMESI